MSSGSGYLVAVAALALALSAPTDLGKALVALREQGFEIEITQDGRGYSFEQPACSGVLIPGVNAFFACTDKKLRADTLRIVRSALCDGGAVFCTQSVYRLPAGLTLDSVTVDRGFLAEAPVLDAMAREHLRALRPIRN